MKSMYLRSSVAIACALSLAACGGSGGGSLSLGGQIFGLAKEGLVLQNNNGNPLPISATTTSFVFPGLVGEDSTYNVTVKTQPNATVCTVVNGSGKAGAFSVSTVQVNCLTNSYDLGGSISGLDANGLVLVNGADRMAIKAGATSFTMTRPNTDGTYPWGKVPDGAPYGVTVLTQPAGRTCTVVNGVGTMGSAAIDNIQVNCI